MRSRVSNVSRHACHELFQGSLTVVLVDQQDLLDGALLKAHLVELGQETQELGSLQRRVARREFEEATPRAARVDGPSPCFHSSGTSPGLLPPELRRNPTHTDDLGIAGI